MRRLQKPHTIAAVLSGPLLLVGAAFVVPVHGQEGEAQTSAPPNGKTTEKRFTPSAPPIIPHPIYDIPCMTCHKTERSVASRIPHPPYPHCTQCHVVQTDAPPFRKNLFAERVKESGKPAVKASPPPVKQPPVVEKKAKAPEKRVSEKPERGGKPTTQRPAESTSRTKAGVRK